MSYVLHTAPSAFGVANASPHCTRAESLLRLSGVAFSAVPASPTQGPRKKIPFLTCPEGAVISDTINIRRHLEAHEGLTLAPSAVDLLVRRLVEEHLYWVQVYFRWVHHPHAVREQLFGDVPALIRPLVFAMVRRQVQRDLWGQGLGRRPEHEILSLAEEDLDALAHALGDGPTYGEGGLADADLSVHALLDQVLSSTFEDALVHAVRQRTALVAHHRHVTEQLGRL